jgi:hypothetical protein
MRTIPENSYEPPLKLFNPVFKFHLQLKLNILFSLLYFISFFLCMNSLSFHLTGKFFTVKKALENIKEKTRVWNNMEIKRAKSIM